MCDSDQPTGFLSCLARRFVLLVEGLLLATGTGFVGTLMLFHFCLGPLRGADGIAAGAWILVAAVVAAISAPVGLVLTWILTSESSDRGFDRWQWLMAVLGLVLGIVGTQFFFAQADLAVRIVLAVVIVPLSIKIVRAIGSAAIHKLIRASDR